MSGIQIWKSNHPRSNVVIVTVSESFQSNPHYAKLLILKNIVRHIS
jgi:hypothetical protein